jgi:hypothetical protein
MSAISFNGSKEPKTVVPAKCHYITTLCYPFQHLYLTCSGTDEERNLAACLAFQDQPLELADNHLAVLVGWDGDAVFSAQAADGGTRLDRVMRLVGREHAQVAWKASRSVLFVAWEHLVARREEGIQVGDGATGSKDRVAASVADDLAHLCQHNGLHQDEHGSDLVGEHVGVGCCRQPLAGHRDDVQSARQLIEEMRVACEKIEREQQHEN